MVSSSRSIIQSFLDYLKFEKRYSAHTYTAYETDLTAFFDYLRDQFNETDIAAVTHTLVRSWLASLKDGEMTARTINRKISSLKSFFKYHVKMGTISGSPMGKVVSPRPGKRLPVYVKEEETKQLIETLNGATESWKTLNAKMLITLFYTTGMRLSELIQLKEKQVDVSRTQVKVLGKGNKERVIPLSREVIAHITAYIAEKKKQFEGKEEVLLVTERGKKLYPKYAYLLVKQYLEQAGTLDKKSPHVLRHTFATHLMNGGADLVAVKELLGHSSLSSTQIYTHNSIEKLRNVYKKAHPKA